MEDRLGQAVDRFVEDLTLGMPPDERAARQELDAAAQQDFADCAKAAKWLEHAVVGSSREQMTKSGLAQLDPGILFETPDLGKELGDFEIIREVGRGGMGIVFEARQKSLNRRVALKVLPPGVRWSEAAATRFAREAKTAGKLRHPHIVPVFAFGEERGVCYFAMQYVDGFTLSELAESYDAGRAPKPVEVADSPAGRAAWPAQLPRPDDAEYYRRIAAAMARVAGAVQYAHERGVVHRDIKPSNLMLDARGTVWITDFGLARLADDASVTRSGQLLGTLCYMSPEQAAGKSDSGEKADIYGLGATLYELIALRAPFAALKPEALLRRIRESEPDRPSSLNPHAPLQLEAIALKAMAKNPANRYATAAEMAQDLERFLEQPSVMFAKVGGRGRRGPRRRFRGWIIPAGAAAVAVVAVALIASFSIRAQRRTAPAVSAPSAQPASDPVGELIAAGRATYERDDLEGARARFQAAAERQPDAVLPHVYLGLLALRDETGEARRGAQNEFRAALERAPGSQLLYHLNALAQAEQRADWLRLQRQLRRVVEPCAEQFAADGFYALGRAVEFREPAWAMELMNQALGCRPEFTEALAYRGWLSHRLGQHAAALSDLSAACERESGRPIYQIWRGWVFDALGRPEEARADFDRAIELDDSITARTERFLWMKSRHPDLQPPGTAFDDPFGRPPVPGTELLDEYRRIVRLEPEGFADHYAMGKVHATAGRPRLALAAFRDAVANLPEGKVGYLVAAAHLELARILGDHYGRDRDAEDNYRQAVTACPSLEFYLALSDFYERRGRWKDMIGALDDAVTAGLRKDARVRVARAKAYHGLNQPELAEGELIEALRAVDAGGQELVDRAEIERMLDELRGAGSG